MSTIRYWAILFLLLAGASLFAQTEADSSLLFEAAKGLLRAPLEKCKQTPKLKVEEKYESLLSKGFSYVCNKADTVRAVYDGTIVSVQEVSGLYLVMTKFGQYYIGYSGLSKPKLKIGNIVRRNQAIGTLSPTLFMPGVLSMSFYKEDVEVDPGDWIKQ